MEQVAGGNARDAGSKLADTLAAGLWTTNGAALLLLGQLQHDAASWCLSSGSTQAHCALCYSGVAALAVATFHAIHAFLRIRVG